jgi:hypothetical protein
MLSFSGLVGEPATGVSIAYSTDIGSQQAIVQTEILAPPPSDVHLELAFSAAHLLVGSLDPTSRSEGDRDTKDALARIRVLGEAHENWTATMWSIDGRALEARFQMYGPGWAGFALLDETRGVAVASCGLSGEALGLQSLGSSVGFVTDFYSTLTTKALEHGQPRLRRGPLL